MHKKIMIFMIFSSIFLSLCFIYSSTFNKDQKPSFAPINPEFLIYKNNSKKRIASILSKESLLNGWIPSPVDLSHIKGLIDKRVYKTYPSRYDLRGYNKLPPIRNQGQCGSCWIFGTFASLESCLLPEEICDFSEQHLNANHGFDFQECAGGNIYISTAYFARWDGPVTETHYPYPYFTPNKVNSETSMFLAKHIQQVIFLPNRCGPDVVLVTDGDEIKDGYEPVPRDPLGNNTVKWFITNYGAITSGIKWDSSCYNSSTYGFYYKGEPGINHAISIVGWDDNYPADNFNTIPPGNGAFIIRNSWGFNWGEDGYFYISYYDTALTTDASFNNAEDEDNYATIYQYDPFGVTSSFGGLNTTYWGANIFESSSNQSLSAVSFYTNDSNVNHEIFIYKNISNNNPVKGTLAAEKAGSLTYAGYYTIKLDSLVALNPGEKFSVVVKFINSGYKYPVPVESPIPDYSSSASANAGESYVSRDGIVWQDLTQFSSNSNVCIKAFTALNSKSIIKLSGTRETEKAWLIKRGYGVIRFEIENLQDVPVSKVLIYRKKIDENSSILCEITQENFQTGHYTYYDKYIEENQTYIYRAVACDSSGFIIGKSNIVSI